MADAVIKSGAAATSANRRLESVMPVCIYLMKRTGYVDQPHKIWEFLRAWVPSPGSAYLAGLSGLPERGERANLP